MRKSESWRKLNRQQPAQDKTIRLMNERFCEEKIQC